MSVLEKAQTVTARARTYAEGRVEQDQRRQIDLMLTHLEREIAQLRTAVELQAAARTLGVPVADVTVDVGNGLDALRTSAAQGLPAQQALRSARDKARRGRETVEAAVITAWGPWAEQQVANLHVNRVKRLGPQHRVRAGELVRNLQAAASSQPSASLVGRFQRDVQELQATLATIGSDDPFVLIFDRIRTGRLTLADLTNSELELLRSDDGAASQISLRFA
jgi:hypothetical protein